MAAMKDLKWTLAGFVGVVLIIGLVWLVRRDTDEVAVEEPEDMGDLIALIDTDIAVEAEHVRQLLEEVPESERAHFMRQPQRLVEQTVDRVLLVREAERRGVVHSPLYQRALEELEPGPGLEERALVRALLWSELEQLPPMTEDQLREAFEQNREFFPGAINFDNSRELIEGVLRHSYQSGHVITFTRELRSNANVRINAAAAEVLTSELATP